MNIRNGIENLGRLQPPQGAASNDAAPVTVKAGTGALPADTAQVSNAAGQVASTASASEVRTEKVAAIQSALQAGTYKVPASEVSRKIVSDLIVPE